MSASWTVNDTTPPLQGTCKNAGSPVDLSAATVAVHVRRYDGTVINREATSKGDDGTWSLTWTTGDLTVPGIYKVQVQATYSGGGIQTFAGADFEVGPEIA